VANEDKSTRYQRARRRASAAAVVVDGALLTGATSGVLQRVMSGLTGFPSDSLSSAAALVAGLWTCRLLALGPVEYWAEVLMARRYGAAGVSSPAWAAAYARRGVLAGAAVAAAAVVVAASRAAAGTWWWLMAALVVVGLVGAAVRVVPALVTASADVAPLDRPALDARLQRLAARAGVAHVDVQRWHVAGRQSAMLVGTGDRQRVLLTTGLLDSLGDEEVEVVVAHEMAHHARRDMWVSALFVVLVAGAGLYLADQVMATAAPTLRVAPAADGRALSLVGLVLYVVHLVATPLVNAVSRAQERRADRTALTWTGNPPALVRSLKRIGAAHLAEERPSLVAQAFFGSHPSVHERIAAAEAWRDGPGRARSRPEGVVDCGVRRVSAPSVARDLPGSPARTRTPIPGAGGRRADVPQAAVPRAVRCR
jgi:STE24 endopeptidase